MLLEQLASLASVVSAVAVVASVIYASLQIRHNTLAVRASSFQQVVNSFAAISFDIAMGQSSRRPLLARRPCICFAR